MRHMKRRRRLRLGGATPLALGAIVAFALFATGGTAGASPAASPGATPDPQTTNVPYLAWAGEHIRLERCFTSTVTATQASSFDFGLVRAELLVEDWSGNASFKPAIENSTVKLFFTRSEEQEYLCASGDAISLDPGMARIGLAITDNAGVLGLPGYNPANPVVKQQFLAGWMTLNTPTLTQLAASSFPSSAQANAAKALGDPLGNGHFMAGGMPGILAVKVTGSMPMEGGWEGLVGKSSVTLPNEWALLAEKLATDSNPSDANPAMRWDIHDDQLPTEGHVLASGCLSTAALTIDAVDNCAFGNPSAPSVGGPTGPFSTVNGLSSASTIGPFDPVRAAETLLSDGKLDAGDAPMPAARIDVMIAPNSGGATDATGVGYLSSQSKEISYSRDFTGAPTASNLYAPFYYAWLPATGAGPVSSGIDGPSSGSNFTGFLNDPSKPYHFWDIADTLTATAGGPTSCLRLSPSPQTDSPMSNPWHYYQNPSGPSTVVAYTDEHGEAQVQWNPGMGFYFNSLIDSGAAITNANGGCDLQSLYNVVGGLGSANITATARYPYKPVDFPSMSSNTVHTDVTSLWSKTLGYFPKGSGTANANARIVVAHAQSIDGSPFAGEKVCWFADSNAEGMQIFQGTVGEVSYAGTRQSGPPGSEPLCVKSDGNGNAAIEVFDSNPNTVNVIADFENEGILRSIDVNFASSAGGGTPPPTPASGSAGGASPTSTTGSGGSEGTHAPSTADLQHVAPGLLGAVTPARHRGEQIRMARLVRRHHGRSYVLVRVSSHSKKRARIRLRLTLRHVAGGHRSAHHRSRGKSHRRTVRRTRWRSVSVRTNRVVRILVPRNVMKVRVSLR